MRGKIITRLLPALLLAGGLLLAAALYLKQSSIPWDLAELSKTPQYWEAPTSEPGVKAVWIEGPPYKGNPTRAFAYYGIPAGKEKAPGMVLLHGGGGTAFAEWVRLWNRRGFAAIAVDTMGAMPSPTAGQPWKPRRQRHEYSGPSVYFANIDAPVTDQWSYHAVAVAILSHSFLRAQPGVDAARIGVTGISWGGYLTAIVASLDQRFRLGIPVYGCGFLGEDSAWLEDLARLGPARAAKWLKLWDPSSYLSLGRSPMLWVNGTNDFYYVMPSWQKSYRLPQGKRTLSLQPGLKHSHPEGVKPGEIYAYAQEKLMDGPPLIVIEQQGASQAEAWAVYGARTKPVKAVLNFTRDTGKWQERKWESIPAAIAPKARRISATIPGTARSFFLNLMDERGLTVSAEHQER